MKFENIKINENNKINKSECEKLPLTNPIYNKTNFEEFSKLKTNRKIKSVDKKDLPDEFSGNICEFIDIFRRKQ